MKKYVITTMIALFLIGIAFSATNGPAPIPNPPNFYVNSSLTTLCKGQTNYIPITVSDLGFLSVSPGETNTTSAMSAVTFSLSSKYFTPIGNSTGFITSVFAGQPKTAVLHIFVSPNASLITTASLSIDYNYLVYYSDSEVRNLTFEVQTCPSPLDVNVSPKEVVSGTIQNISINLTNTGNTTLNSLFLHTSIPSIDGAIVGNPQVQVGSLLPGSSYNLNTEIFVSRNASIQSFPFNTTATFYNGTDIEQVSNSTSLIPTGGIDMLVSGTTVSPSPASPDGIFSISFILTDVGTSGASAVTAEAELPKGFTAYGSNPTYVGDISADGQSPVTLTLVASNKSSTKPYVIPIVVNYLNSLRQNQTKTFDVNVSVFGSFNSISGVSGSAPNGAVEFHRSSGILIYILIAAIAVIIVLSYMLVKEKRRGRHAKER